MRPQGYRGQEHVDWLRRLTKGLADASLTCRERACHSSIHHSRTGKRGGRHVAPGLAALVVGEPTSNAAARRGGGEAFGLSIPDRVRGEPQVISPIASRSERGIEQRRTRNAAGGRLAS